MSVQLLDVDVAARPVDVNGWQVLSFADDALCFCTPLVNDAGSELFLLVTSDCGSAWCAVQPFFPILTADSERKRVLVPVQNNLILFLTNDPGLPLRLTATTGVVLEPVTTGLILSKADVSLFGHYLGWTVQGHDAPFRLETVEMQYAPTRTWDTT